MKQNKKTELTDAYHRGYDQGRFDEYADRMGKERAERVRARLEKQKNCPYCHGTERIQNRLIYETRRDILVLKDNSLEYTLALPNHKEYEAQAYVEYCPMCGRYLLNEEV